MFICARVYLGRSMGVGVRAQSRGARAQLGVCIHDLCGLYTEGGEGDDLPSLHVRTNTITASEMILYKKCHNTTNKVGDVSL